MFFEAKFHVVQAGLDPPAWDLWLSATTPSFFFSFPLNLSQKAEKHDCFSTFQMGINNTPTDPFTGTGGVLLQLSLVCDYLIHHLFIFVSCASDLRRERGLL